MSFFENVRQQIEKLIPSSVISDIACFVFYDKHPKYEKNIDITVCTKDGELREYSQRDLKSSLNLNCVIEKPSDLTILRNNKSELFYLLSSKDVLFIISSRDKLEIHRKLTDIDRYEVNDVACCGETYLKVIKKDDAVPILFDSNFECLGDRGIIPNLPNTEDSFPILNELRRKLVEARYSTKCNEKTHAQYLSLHQKVSLLFQNQQSSTDSTVFQDNLKNITAALKLKTHKPCVKICNKKIVIMFHVLCKVFSKNIHLLLHNTTIPSLVYTTKIFRKLPTPPYWQEVHTNALKPDEEYVVTAIVELKELQHELSRIELSGSIAYEVSKQEYLVPFEDVAISSTEVMGDDFDVLSNCRENDQNTVIAVLAATEKIKLFFRHIKEQNERDIDLSDLFCSHLQMDRVENASNVVLYRKSPYHALNGTMLVFHERNPDNLVPVSVYTRSPSQVLVLLHCIYDAVPAKIIATTPSYRITSKTDDLSHYNEDITHRTTQLNHIDYATSMLKRSTIILEHLDSSMIKMNESKDLLIQSKVGTHIDLFAGGVDMFKKFRESMMEEAKESVDTLIGSKSLSKGNVTVESLVECDSMNKDSGSDVMYID